MSKKKNRKRHPQCPCCLGEKHRTEMEIAIADMMTFEKSKYSYYKELIIDPLLSFLDSDMGWACDHCLQQKNAIKANPALQHSKGLIHLAYYDSKFNCSTCQKDFIFGKEEKRLWYERLKFSVYSEPNNCPACRKEIRHLKNQNKVLSTLLMKKENELSESEIENIIEIYKEWRKTERQKYFVTLLRKRKSR